MCIVKDTKHKAYGFTIVELLIVIVIIAILAAITMVAYNGITQRAKNSAIVAAAEQSYKLINAYVAANGVYPALGDGCLSYDSGCYSNTAGSTIGKRTDLTTNLATLGSQPTSISMGGPTRGGLVYSYSATRKLSGNIQPALLYYWLYGTNQNCSLSNVVVGWQDGVPSTTGYTAGNDGGENKTLCYISIPGPSA